TSRYELSWSPEEGLKGSAFLKVDLGESVKGVGFESSLEFLNLKPVENSFDLGFVGRASSGNQVFFGNPGVDYRCDVWMPESTREGVYRLKLPRSAQRSLLLSVPVEYELLSNQVLQPVSFAPKGPVAYRRYWIAGLSEEFLVKFVLSEKIGSNLFTNDVVSFEDHSATWVSEFVLDGSEFSAEKNLITVPAEFECLGAQVNGKAIAAEKVQSDSGRAVFRLIQSGRGGERGLLEFRLEFKTRIRHDIAFRLDPLKLSGNYNTFSKWRISESPEWVVNRVESAGFSVSQSQAFEGLQFDQRQRANKLVLHLKRRQTVTEIQRAEIDLFDGQIVTRQLFTGLQPNAVLRFNEGWTVNHAIDVFQDDLPIGFEKHMSNTGDLIALQNENSSVWVVATKSIAPGIDYEIGNFLFSPIGKLNTLIELKSGLINGFRDGISFPHGLPSETEQTGLGLVPLAELKPARFRLPADRQKYQADFEYQVDVQLGMRNAKIDYHIFWNGESQREAIIELELDPVSAVVFPDGQVGSARILSSVEKRRLGLAVERSYWLLESHRRLPDLKSHLIFSTSLATTDSQLKIVLPVGFNDEKLKGRVSLAGNSFRQVSCMAENLVEL
ncbi:MAG: hypothetical protein VX438_04155, partial [Planctomycetota bacterium]|nr:hypothetical protein [Planctomycetota bacterium]